MKSLVLIICITFLPFAQPQVEQSGHDTLKLLHIIFRHGNRYPYVSPGLYKPYFNVSYNIGALTETGKNRSFLLGKWLQNRYGTFLKSYNTETTKSFNTFVERTKTTSDLVLKGLFLPENSYEKWSKQIQLEKNTTLPKNSTLLVSLNPECTNYLKLYKKYITSSDYENIPLKYTTLINDLKVHLYKKFCSYFDLFAFYDFLLVQKDLGHSLPEWAKSFMNKIRLDSIKTFLKLTTTEDLSSILAGNFIKYVTKVTSMKFKNQLQPEKRKLFLFSAHDYNICAVLKLLGYDVTDKPPYNSCLMFEAHTIDNVDGLKVYYKDGLKNDAVALSIPRCGHFCPLSKFTSIYKQYFHTYDTC